MNAEHLRRLTRASILFVGVVAIGVLVSWWLGLGDVTLPGRVARPMAPTTALLFLAIAAAGWWRHVAPDGSAARWVALAVGVAVAGFSAITLLSIPWVEAVGIPRGFMVPMTAVVFLLIGIAMAADTIFRPAALSTQLGATVGMLVAFSGAAFLFSHVLNVPVVVGQPLPAWTSGVAFIALGLGLIFGVGANAWPSLVLTSQAQAGRARWWAWVATMVFVVLFVAAVAAMAVRANLHRERDAAIRLAGTAADTEAQQISAWFGERLADANVQRDGFLTGDEVLRLVAGRADAGQRAYAQGWLLALARHYHYEHVTLTDPAGRVLLTDGISDAREVDGRVLAAIQTAAETGAVQFVDMRWGGGPVREPMSWVAPLGGAHAKAILILSTDLEGHAESALEVWTASRPSAEVLVVGGDGDQALFLNHPRLLPADMRPVFPMSGVLPYAIRIAVAGEQGEVAATDYRDVPVFAAVRQIAGTPWAVITKIDQAEVYAAANETGLIIVASLSASALAVIMAGGLLWYRRELKTTEHIVGLTQEHVKADDMVRTLTTAIAQSPVSIVITDMAGTISYVNPMFTQVSGYTPAEAIGQNAHFLKSGELSADGYRQLWDTILAGQVWHGELHNKRKNGELYWEEATIAPVRDSAGRPSGFVALKREITAEKTAETAHALLQSEFVQAQKMESVGRLAGGVAHDFNNMLAVILGHAELALDGLDDASPQREHLVEILQAGQRSSDLTRQLLAFARKQKVAPTVLNLNEEITKTLKMLRRLIGENIELVWTPYPGLWNVFIDPAQVDQILANLTVNGRDAIAGPGKMTITTSNVTVTPDQARDRPALRPGVFVRLSIQDTGCGMSPEVLAHLFEPFYTTKAEGQGTGLGTATVYGIVTQNNGAIEVDSAVGVGTTMHIYLPRAHDEALVTDAANSALPRGTETILVVEDEAAMLSICTRMLERLGYSVIGCPSAADALAIADTHAGTIHALLTDVVMPGMNGRELADCIAKRRPGIRVAFMSGYTADLISQQGVLDDGVHFVPKPFSSSQLAVKMREVFE